MGTCPGHKLGGAGWAEALGPTQDPADLGAAGDPPAGAAEVSVGGFSAHTDAESAV